MTITQSCARIFGFTAVTALFFCLQVVQAASFGVENTPWGKTVDLAPFDIQRNVRDYFLERLPKDWFINDPERTDGGYVVGFHIPVDWGGNPVSAARNFCPPRDHVMWRHIERLYLIPYYHQLRWAGVECR